MFDLQSTAIILAVFLVAGIVKGVVGLGLPSISLGFLTIAFNLPTAMALLIAPSAATNLVQAFTGGRGLILIKRLWPFYFSATLMIGIGSWFFQRMNTDNLTILLGILLSLYAFANLMNFRIQTSAISNPFFAVAFGSTNGILTGLTGSFVVPGVMYLQALGLTRDGFVQSMGILFTLSTIMLGICLAYTGLLHLEMTAASVIGVVPALIGMILGQHCRKKLSDGQFRLIFFYAILVLGLCIITRTLLTC